MKNVILIFYCFAGFFTFLIRKRLKTLNNREINIKKDIEMSIYNILIFSIAHYIYFI